VSGVLRCCHVRCNSTLRWLLKYCIAKKLHDLCFECLSRHEREWAALYKTTQRIIVKMTDFTELGKPTLKYCLELECVILQQPLCEEIGSLSMFWKLWCLVNLFMSTLTVECFYLFFHILIVNVGRQCTIQKSDS